MQTHEILQVFVFFYRMWKIW